MSENIKKDTENIPVDAEKKDKVTTVTKTTTQKKTTNTKAKTVKKEVKEDTGIDFNNILDFEDEKKVSLSFNQNKSIANKLTTLADKTKHKKVGTLLNSILKEIVDVEKKQCKIDIKETGEDKIQNTYKINETILNILKDEAKNKKLSLNDYLNKVLDIVLKDVKEEVK